MATLGWVKVGAAVDVGPLKKGFNSAADTVKGFTGALAGIAAAAGVALSVGALKQYVGSTIDAIAESNALAARLGFSAEAFQRLTYAARLSHVDIDTLGTSLSQMDKRLGQVAITGTGPAADALKRFGINAKQLATLGPEKAFGVLVGVFQRIVNPMERAAVAADLFGKQGQAMINLVSQGGPALAALGAQASAMGFALSGIDNAKVVEAKHALVELGLAAEGFANLLAVKLAPFLTVVIEKYTEWAYESGKTTSFIANGMSIVVASIGYAMDAVNIFSTAFFGIRSVVGFVVASVATGFEGILEVVSTAISALSEVAGLLSDGAKSLFQKAAVQIDGFADKVKDFRGEMVKASNTDFDKAAKSFEQIGKGGDNVRKLVEQIELEANKKAQITANNKAGFITPGAVNAKIPDIAFAGAVESGTKEARSAILASKGLQINAQAQLAQSAQQTANNTQQTVQLLRNIQAQLIGGGNQGNIPAVPSKIAPP